MVSVGASDQLELSVLERKVCARSPCSSLSLTET